MLGGTSCGPSASLPCAASIDGEMGLPPAAATKLALPRSSCPTCKQAPCTPPTAVSPCEPRSYELRSTLPRHAGPAHVARFVPFTKPKAILAASSIRCLYI